MGIFRDQIALMSVYVKRIARLTGLDECMCEDCNAKKREIAILLGEYGMEYASLNAIPLLYLAHALTKDSQPPPGESI